MYSTDNRFLSLQSPISFNRNAASVIHTYAAQNVVAYSSYTVYLCDLQIMETEVLLERQKYTKQRTDVVFWRHIRSDSRKEIDY